MSDTLQQTEQMLFEKMVKHLWEQNDLSAGTHGTCFYRHPSGKSCAVGGLITDEVIREGYIENLPANRPAVVQAVIKSQCINTDHWRDDERYDFSEFLRAGQFKLHDELASNQRTFEGYTPPPFVFRDHLLAAAQKFATQQLLDSSFLSAFTQSEPGPVDEPEMQA